MAGWRGFPARSTGIRVQPTPSTPTPAIEAGSTLLVARTVRIVSQTACHQVSPSISAHNGSARRRSYVEVAWAASCPASIHKDVFVPDVPTSTVRIYRDVILIRYTLHYAEVICPSRSHKSCQSLALSHKNTCPL